MSNLLEKASIITTPTAYNVGSINSVKPSESPFADFTFTRNTTATRVNASGLIESVVNNLPRIDYTGGGCGSWLLEPQSTNLCSEYLSLNAVNGGVVTLNSAVSPDGTQNATKVNFSTGSNSGGKISISSSASTSTEYTFSFYAKNSSGDGSFRLKIDTDTVVDLVNQNFTATAEWVRYTHTFTTDARSSSFESTSRFRKSTTTDNNEVLFYGMQLEERSFATSVIPTSGSTVTRAADSATDAGSSDLISSTEGVLYAEISALFNTGVDRIISISDGSNNNTLRLELDSASNKVKVTLKNSATTAVQAAFVLTDITQFFKVAASYDQNDLKLYVNGVLRDSATISVVLPSNTFNRLNFNRGDGAFSFEGNVKCAAVFKEALTDAELTALTTI